MNIGRELTGSVNATLISIIAKCLIIFLKSKQKNNLLLRNYLLDFFKTNQTVSVN
jgi:hypothetical protein